MSNKPKSEIYVAWKQVTYRSVVLALLGVVLLLAAGMHLAFPQFTDNTVKAVGRLSTTLLERVAGLAPPLKGPSVAVSQQAHFTALDGTVRVRKGKRHDVFSRQDSQAAVEAGSFSKFVDPVRPGICGIQHGRHRMP